MNLDNMSKARLFRAPGRVNLIGEHTDYNLGFVLPIALDLDTRIRTALSPDGRLHVHSATHNEGRSWTIADIAALTPQSHWSDYVIGVAQQLQARGFSIPALSLHIDIALIGLFRLFGCLRGFAFIGRRFRIF